MRFASILHSCVSLRFFSSISVNCRSFSWISSLRESIKSSRSVSRIFWSEISLSRCDKRFYKSIIFCESSAFSSYIILLLSLKLVNMNSKSRLLSFLSCSRRSRSDIFSSYFYLCVSKIPGIWDSCTLLPDVSDSTSFKPFKSRSVSLSPMLSTPTVPTILLSF